MINFKKIKFQLFVFFVLLLVSSFSPASFGQAVAKCGPSLMPVLGLAKIETEYERTEKERLKRDSISQLKEAFYKSEYCKKKYNDYRNAPLEYLNPYKFYNDSLEKIVNEFNQSQSNAYNYSLRVRYPTICRSGFHFRDEECNFELDQNIPVFSKGTIAREYKFHYNKDGSSGATYYGKR